MKRLILLVAVVAAFALVSSALAAKPTPTLVFTPNPVYPQMPYDITGCGYPHAATLTIVQEESSETYPEYYPVVTDSSGCFRLGTFAAGTAGTSVEVLVYHGSKILAGGVLQTIDWPS
jgi:hypothetical protein